MKQARSVDRRVRTVLNDAGFAVGPGTLTAPGRSAWRHALVIRAAGDGPVDSESLGYIQASMGRYTYPN